MSRPAIPPADRLILSLMKYGGSAPLTKIRANFYGRLTRVMLNKVLLELDDLIEVEKTRAPGSKRRTTSIVLTWKGEVAARVLKPGWRRKRVTLAELKAELAARQAQLNPWACKIQKDAEHRREFERQKAAGWSWRPPKPAKASPELSAPKPAIPAPVAPYAPPAEYNMLLTPAAPAPAAPADDYYASGMRAQSQALSTIHESNRGYDNSPKAEPTAPTGETRSQVMERARANGCVTAHAGLMFEGEEFGRDWKRWAVASKKKGG